MALKTPLSYDSFVDCENRLWIGLRLVFLGAAVSVAAKFSYELLPALKLVVAAVLGVGAVVCIVLGFRALIREKRRLELAYPEYLRSAEFSLSESDIDFYLRTM